MTVVDSGSLFWATLQVLCRS